MALAVGSDAPDSSNQEMISVSGTLILVRRRGSCNGPRHAGEGISAAAPVWVGG
jgi:hypothetical protein